MPVETVHLNADIITLNGLFYPGADFPQARQKQSRTISAWQGLANF